MSGVAVPLLLPGRSPLVPSLVGPQLLRVPGSPDHAGRVGAEGAGGRRSRLAYRLVNRLAGCLKIAI